MVLMSILSIFAKIISCISYGIDSPHVIRKLNLVSSACWIFYNFTFWSLTGAIDEILGQTAAEITGVPVQNEAAEFVDEE